MFPFWTKAQGPQIDVPVPLKRDRMSPGPRMYTISGHIYE